MAVDWVHTTVAGLERWAAENENRFDLRGARMLLELAEQELDLTGPGDLTAETLRELFLEVFPEMVVAGPEDVPSVLAAGRAVVGFLDETGALPAGRAAELARELDLIAPEFGEIVTAGDAADQAQAAEVITGMMAGDGVDLDDEDAVSAWLTEFEALPEEERFARTAVYLRDTEELIVPPVRLAPEPELAAAARASGLATQVVTLATWAGEREVDEDDGLTPTDAVAAVEALGLATPRWAEDALESMEEIPELDRLWWAAIEAKALVVEDGRVAPGPAVKELQEGDDETALAAWLHAFDGAVTQEPGVRPELLETYQLVQSELTGVLIQLYEQDRPSTRTELAEAMAGHLAEAYDPPHRDDEDIAQAVGLEIDDLIEWGVLAAAADGGHVLTPLGVWGVRELLLADGFTAPLVGELTAAPAAGLIAGLIYHREDTADEEIDRWLGARDAGDAAAELVEVMRTGTPGARNLAAALLHRVDPAAEPVVREAHADPVLRPYAALWLHSQGDETVELSPGDMMWVFADTVAGMLETVDADAAVASALADAPAGADLGAMIDELWRIDHPDIVEVLDALGAHHPDKTVAKAARKAAFKARSGG